MGDTSNYHSLTVGYNKFFIDKRYINLKPCGDGSYGFVASAYDVTTGREDSWRTFYNFCVVEHDMNNFYIAYLKE